MEKLIYSTFREGYGIDQIHRTMTAGELINFLAQYELKGSLEDLQAEEEEYRDSIPENMQESERYEKADEACDNLSSAVDSLEEAISSIEAAIE